MGKPNARVTVRGVAAVCALLALASCTARTFRSKIVKPENVADVDTKADFVKCHMPDGSLYVLEKWNIEGDTIRGDGVFWDAERRNQSKGAFEVKISSVALIETTQPERVQKSGGLVLGVITGASLAVTALCLANPKACFGSCPTFYARNEAGALTLQAEGFSASIARTLEATDIDSMWSARATGQFDLLMTNDALETHLVDATRVLAVPRVDGHRVYRSGTTFRPARATHAPLTCKSETGDCLAKLQRADGDEYLSPADPNDLTTRETLELELPRGSGEVGVAIHARNSLLNTFVFYQTLAWLGRNAVESILAAERAGEAGAEKWKAFGALLGDLEVTVQRADGSWAEAGAFAEVGPIAREVQLVVLPGGLPKDRLRVRISGAKGNWKIDALELVELSAPVEAKVLSPTSVLRNGAPDHDAREKLAHIDGNRLVTYPGDAYTLRFELPAGDHELFLESRGYYYEWMRKQWMAEESPSNVAMLLAAPRLAMRTLAPMYKKIEPDIERVFWSSKVGSK